MITIPVILAFAMMDYFLYNIWGESYLNQKINPYRIFVVVIQILIIAALYYFTGIRDAIVFIVLWWFGIADMLYYIYDWVFEKVFGRSYEDAKFWGKEDTWGMEWLWFTPYGLLGMDVERGMFFDMCGFGVAVAIIIKLI